MTILRKFSVQHRARGLRIWLDLGPFHATLTIWRHDLDRDVMVLLGCSLWWRLNVVLGLEGFLDGLALEMHDDQTLAWRVGWRGQWHVLTRKAQWRLWRRKKGLSA